MARHLPPNWIPPAAAHLAKGTLPAQHEHFGGYVRRLAAANLLPDVGTIASLLGLPGLTPFSSAQMWQQLASATGVDLDKFRQLRMHSGNFAHNASASIDGHILSMGFIDTLRLRLCGVCQLEDRPVAAAFAIRHVTTCAEHAIRLTDSCDCGRERRIYEPRSLWACPECGRDPSTLPAVPAPQVEVEISRSIENTLNGRPTGHSHLPAWFDKLTLAAKVSVLERFGRVSALERQDEADPRRTCTKANRVDEVRSRSISDDRAVAIDAAAILENWPDGYHALLSRLIDRHPNEHAYGVHMRRFGSKAGRLAIRRVSDGEGGSVEEIERQRLAHLFRSTGYVPNRERLLRPSRRLANVAGTVAKDLSDEPNRDTFADAFECARRLNSGDRELDAWFEIGALSKVEASGRIAVRRTHLDGLLATLAGLADATATTNAPDDGFMDARTALKARGRHYRRTSFVEDVMNGRIRVRKVEGQEGLSGLTYHVEDFHLMRSVSSTAHRMTHDHHVRIQFLEFVEMIWGQKLLSFDELRDLGDAGRVRVLRAGHIWLYSVRDVVDLMQRRTSNVIFKTDEGVLGKMREHPLSAVLSYPTQL